MEAEFSGPPLKIGLCTVGSTGDIQPFLALGKELMRQGHDVLAVSHPFHASRFASVGIPFAGCGPFVEQAELNALLDKMMLVRNPVKQLEVLMKEAFLKDGLAYFKAAKLALAGRELVVAHSIDFLGQQAAASLGIPRIGVVLTHGVIPTPKSTPALVPNLGILNPLVWRLVTFLLKRPSKFAMKYLGTLDGSSIKIERFCALGPDLNLLAASPTLAGLDSKYLPANVKCTGAWILKEEAYLPDQSLADFLGKYPRPVVVSFGSMGGNQGPALTAKVLEALRILGLPAVIQGGYAGLQSENPPPNVHFAGFVPHDYLFGQACCVVHHAGAGTTMAACRAGVPSVPVVFIADQPYFAERMRRLGIAPRFIWRYHLSASILAKRIQQALDKGEMGKRAAALKGRFLEENGVAVASMLVEKFGHQRRENK